MRDAAGASRVYLQISLPLRIPVAWQGCFYNSVINQWVMLFFGVNPLVVFSVFRRRFPGIPLITIKLLALRQK